MADCIICQSAQEQIGALCAGCAGAIAAPSARAPGIISSRVSKAAAEGWLVDEWGQPHPVGARCAVGRDRDRSDLAIADLVISAEHAVLWREAACWWLRDRGSANGTRLAGGPPLREAELPHRSRLWFGTVGFYFWGQPTFRAQAVAPPRVRTVIPNAAGFLLVAPQGELRVRAASGHPLDSAPGELEFRARNGRQVSRSALGRLQFQLLRRLCEAAVKSSVAPGQSSSVGTQELLRALPFQSAQPEANHVRQVVANLRAALRRAGVPGGGSAGSDGVVRAEEGLGYRLTWEVERLRAA